MLPKRDSDSDLVAETDTLLSSNSSEVAHDDDATSSGVELCSRRFWFIFGGILVQYFIAFYDHSFINSVHPVISSEFRASDRASWLETSFLLTSTAFQPLAARISDVFGRRPVQLLTLLTFGLSAAWSAMSLNMTHLILARALSGVGAGGVIVMGPVIANDIIPIRVRGTYQGYINAAVGLGAISGAGLGGILCDLVGWRWGFGIQVPLVAVVFVFAYHNTPATLQAPFAQRPGASLQERAMKLDISGALLLSGAVGCTIIALDFARQAAPRVVLAGLLAVSVGAAWLLVLVERRAAYPLMPVAMITTPPRANLLFSNLLSYMAHSAILFNAPFAFQVLKLKSSSDSGILLMIPNIAITITGVCSGLIMTARGRTKSLMLVGASFLLLGSSLPYWTDHRVSILALASLFVPASAGMGLNTPAVSVAVLATTCRDDQAVMTTTLALWRRLGALLGVAFGSMGCQRALVRELDRWITGPNRLEIIERILKSVKVVQDLDPRQQLEVIHAYEESLHATVIYSLVPALLAFVMLLPIHIPPLNRGSLPRSA